MVCASLWNAFPELLAVTVEYDVVRQSFMSSTIFPKIAIVSIVDVIFLMVFIVLGIIVLLADAVAVVHGGVVRVVPVTTNLCDALYADGPFTRCFLTWRPTTGYSALSTCSVRVFYPPYDLSQCGWHGVSHTYDFRRSAAVQPPHLGEGWHHHLLWSAMLQLNLTMPIN